jgi:hypothetical protein
MNQARASSCTQAGAASACRSNGLMPTPPPSPPATTTPATHLSSPALQWLISDEGVRDLELDIADGLIT